jgi:hypothetical protein
VAGHEAGRSPSSSAEAKNAWSHTFSPPSVSLWHAAETALRSVLYVKWQRYRRYSRECYLDVLPVKLHSGYTVACCIVECDDTFTLACLCFLLYVLKHKSLYLQTKLMNESTSLLNIRWKLFSYIMLARSQCPEGPATGHLDTGSFFLVSLCLKANAEMVPNTPSCYCMLLM